jgi:quinol monooxygenase YgiN
LFPEYTELGKRTLIEFAQLVRRLEPDCLAIEIVQDLDDPKKITMIEKWTDRAAYEGLHQKTPQMKSFVERAGGFFDGPPWISFCDATTIGGAEAPRVAPYGR